MCSILISSVALAAQEIRLSEDIGENGEPSIYGDKVVWSYWDKIHLYDLKPEMILQLVYLSIIMQHILPSMIIKLYAVFVM